MAASGAYLQGLADTGNDGGAEIKKYAARKRPLTTCLRSIAVVPIVPPARLSKAYTASRTFSLSQIAKPSSVWSPYSTAPKPMTVWRRSGLG